MCIKSTPYLHQKSTNMALSIVFFWCFGADIDQIAPLEGAFTAYIYLNYDAKWAKNIFQSCPK